MSHRRLLACLGLVALVASAANGQEREQNVWPAFVRQTDDSGQTESVVGAGPLVFQRNLADGSEISGVRPFYYQRRAVDGRLVEAATLYPLFIYRADAEEYRWSVFQLINRGAPHSTRPDASGEEHRLDVWPVYFSRQSSSPEQSYRAVFPLYGTIKHRFGQDRVTWTLFPIYSQLEKRDVRRTNVLWPIFRKTMGGGQEGFAAWPLFGYKRQPGVFEERFYLWPLFYKNQRGLDSAEPAESVGVLPFYTRDRSSGYVNENYLWPFFGYTDRTSPYRYHETRYFWPLLVQGRGDDRYRSRWAPFYTHSVSKGVDKRWFLWPLVRRDQWTDEALEHTRTQFLYFLYRSYEQRSATNASLAPAEKTHLWPLYSGWTNGAGRRQFQLLSPLEVFFPNNEIVRQTWSPLFAIYRYDRRAPGYTRHAFLFDAVTLRRTPERGEFHLGPLLSVQRAPETGRIALAGGLVGLQRAETGSGWRPFWFKFSRSSENPPSTAR